MEMKNEKIPFDGYYTKFEIENPEPKNVPRPKTLREHQYVLS